MVSASRRTKGIHAEDKKDAGRQLESLFGWDLQLPRLDHDVLAENFHRDLEPLWYFLAPAERSTLGLTCHSRQRQTCSYNRFSYLSGRGVWSISHLVWRFVWIYLNLILVYVLIHAPFVNFHEIALHNSGTSNEFPWRLSVQAVQVALHFRFLDGPPLALIVAPPLNALADKHTMLLFTKLLLHLRGGTVLCMPTPFALGPGVINVLELLISTREIH